MSYYPARTPADRVWEWLGDFGAPLGFVVAMVAVVVGAGWLYVKDENAYAAWCQGKGGHVTTSTHYGSGVAIGAKGSVTPVVTSNTTDYCLTSDGRIIDIR